MDVTVLPTVRPSVRPFVNRMQHATLALSATPRTVNTGIVGGFLYKNILYNTSDVVLFCCIQSAPLWLLDYVADIFFSSCVKRKNQLDAIYFII